MGPVRCDAFRIPQVPAILLQHRTITGNDDLKCRLDLTAFSFVCRGKFPTQSWLQIVDAEGIDEVFAAQVSRR